MFFNMSLEKMLHVREFVTKVVNWLSETIWDNLRPSVMNLVNWIYEMALDSLRLLVVNVNCLKRS